MKRKTFTVAALIISSQLSAQKDTATLGEVIVTANKFEQKQGQTGKVITVITREQLEKNSGKSISQVLNEQAGMVINGAFNAPGSVQTTFLRGASPGRTLILMDGIPVNDPSAINNEFDLNLVSITEVERIEICKGAQSTLYGSDAIAGVINIITTRKDIARPFNVKLSSGYGSNNTSRHALQLYGKKEKLTYTARFSKLQTDGFSSAYDSTGKNHFDKDGYDGRVLNAMVSYALLPTLTAKAFAQHSRYTAGIDAGVFADEKDYRIKNQMFSSGGGLQFKNERMGITANYQYGDLSRSYLNDSLFIRPFGVLYENNRYKAGTRFAELFGNVNVTDRLTLLAGADHRRATMEQQYYSLSSYGPYSSEFSGKSLHQTSLYASLIFRALGNHFTLETGGRYNSHSRYGHNSTFTINPSYSFNSHFRVFGSIASGFKAPSIFQVYDQYSGNSALRPERSVNFEIGLQQTHPVISSRLVGFHRDIKNGIDYNYVSFQYFNFIRQTVDGAELEIRVMPFSALTITGNYTYLNGEEKTQSRKDFSDTTYSYLLRRPKHNLNMEISYRFHKKAEAGIRAKSVSRRHDIGGYKKEDVSLEGYLIFSAYAGYQWKPGIRFFADAQNLTGKKFFDLRGYNSIPFLVNGGITIEL